jgi:small subunit ribosomal protein S1
MEDIDPVPKVRPWSSSPDSLSHRQTSRPWFSGPLKKGQVREGVVKNITDFGAFIEIKEGVDGLIHLSDMSWTKKINHPSEVLKKGDKVECIVMAIDKEKRRISLSMEHLMDDPWDTLAEEFPVGKEVQSSIARLLERGVIVELEGGLEVVPVFP